MQQTKALLFLAACPMLFGQARIDKNYDPNPEHVLGHAIPRAPDPKYVGPAAPDPKDKKAMSAFAVKEVVFTDPKIPGVTIIRRNTDASIPEHGFVIRNDSDVKIAALAVRFTYDDKKRYMVGMDGYTNPWEGVAKGETVAAIPNKIELPSHEIFGQGAPDGKTLVEFGVEYVLFADGRMYVSGSSNNAMFTALQHNSGVSAFLEFYGGMPINKAGREEYAKKISDCSKTNCGGDANRNQFLSTAEIFYHPIKGRSDEEDFIAYRKNPAHYTIARKVSVIPANTPLENVPDEADLPRSISPAMSTPPGVLIDAMGQISFSAAAEYGNLQEPYSETLKVTMKNSKVSFRSDLIPLSTSYGSNISGTCSAGSNAGTGLVATAVAPPPEFKLAYPIAGIYLAPRISVDSALETYNINRQLPNGQFVAIGGIKNYSLLKYTEGWNESDAALSSTNVACDTQWRGLQSLSPYVYGVFETDWLSDSTAKFNGTNWVTSKGHVVINPTSAKPYVLDNLYNNQSCDGGVSLTPYYKDLPQGPTARAASNPSRSPSTYCTWWQGTGHMAPAAGGGSASACDPVGDLCCCIALYSPDYCYGYYGFFPTDDPQCDTSTDAEAYVNTVEGLAIPDTYGTITMELDADPSNPPIVCAAGAQEGFDGLCYQTSGPGPFAAMPIPPDNAYEYTTYQCPLGYNLSENAPYMCIAQTVANNGPSEPGFWASAVNAQGQFSGNAALGEFSFTNSSFAQGSGFIPPGGLLSTDIAVFGDWTGTGHTCAGWFRKFDANLVPSGVWFLDKNCNGVWDDADAYGPGIPWSAALGGDPTDYPVVGDWNGTGQTCIGVFRYGYAWFLDTNCSGFFDWNVDALFTFGGIGGDFPIVVGQNVGVWRCYNPTSSSSQIGCQSPDFLVVMDQAAASDTVQSDHGTGAVFPFGGAAHDQIVVGDWQGTGVYNVGIVRQAPNYSPYTNWFLDDGSHNWPSPIQPTWFFWASSANFVTGKW